MASEGLHEPAELLSEKSKDLHRAIVSLMEDLEAIDWVAAARRSHPGPDAPRGARASVSKVKFDHGPARQRTDAARTSQADA